MCTREARRTEMKIYETTGKNEMKKKIQNKIKSIKEKLNVDLLLEMRVRREICVMKRIYYTYITCIFKRH